MSPSPEQVRQAMQNEQRPPRTHGVMVHDALLHVKNSQTLKTPGGHAGGGVPLSGNTVTGTGELYDEY